MQLAIWRVCVPLLMACAAVSAAGEVVVGPTEPIVLRSGAGIARFVLTNNGSAAVPLALRIGPVTDQTSNVKLPSPKVSFVMEAGEGPPPAQIAGGQSLQLEASVSDFSGASAAEFKLFNGTTELTSLTLVALDDPLTVSIEGEGTSDKQLTSVLGKPAAITLKNGSAEFLTLDWTLLLQGVRQGSGQVKLGPNGTSQIMVNPAFHAYALTDFLRPSDLTGQLQIKLHAPQGVAADLAPAKVLPVYLSMSGSSATWTSVASYLFVSICLIIGGLLSILASSVLPNMIRKVELRRQVTELANRTSSISTRVDSYLRVLLRLERKKIDAALAGVGPFSLTAPDRFNEILLAISRLLKRLVVAERLDALRGRFEEVSATSPPSITDALDKTLDTAAGQLHSFVLPDEDVDVANALLDKAEAALRMLDDKDAQAKIIAVNFTDLKARLQAFPADYFADLQQALPGIFNILSSPFDDARNIYAPMFFAIDHAIAAAQITLNYAIVRATVPTGKSANCDAAGQAALARLKTHECELLNMLGTLSWKSLRAATTLVQQMREDIYEQDVLDQIEQKRAKIVFDTQRARPYLPVNFSIVFDDPRFTGAAALNWITLRWTFPGDLTEEGWKVCHYFMGNEAKSGSRKVPIKVVAQSTRLKKMPEFATEIEVQMSHPPREYSAAIAGSLRFLIAFGVALAGLESGALDQLAKLGFVQATIAIIALGFGADAVKNLLTQSTRPQTPRPAP